MSKENFCKYYNITEDQFYGKEIIYNSLNIKDIELPEGFNPHVKYDLLLDDVKEITYDFHPIAGNLSLENLSKLPDNFNPIVNGYKNYNIINIFLNQSILPIALQVGGLKLNSISKIVQDFSVDVIGDCEISNVRYISNIIFNPKIGDTLYLDYLNNISKDCVFKPIIGNDLYLNNISKIDCIFEPIVEGDLHLDSLEFISKNFNPQVSGEIYLTNLKSETLKTLFLNKAGRDLAFNLIKSIN